MNDVMKRMSAIKGMPVVHQETGKRIGKVEQAYLYAGGERLLGLSIKGDGFRQKKLYASLADIRLIGDVSVIVRKAGRPPKQQPSGPVPGTRVWSSEGEKLGWMSNALIEESTGSVHALEVSRGYCDDLTDGRIWVREFTVRPCGVIAVLRAPG